eukprot:2486648-Ditylum_brightwellii.AAC.1
MMTVQVAIGKKRRTGTSNNNCNTKQDRNGQKVLFHSGGCAENQGHSVIIITPLRMKTSETP